MPLVKDLDHCDPASDLHSDETAPPTTIADAIRVESLYHRYEDGRRQVVAVDHIDLAVRENEFFTLLGPSGCGKTTTLRCLAGLEVPTSGTIELAGTTVFSSRTVVPTHRRDIGMVYQDYAIWPHMTAFENVAFPLRTERLSTAKVKDRVREALSLVNMSEFAERPATQLSGGQQQRLSLARALVRRPRVLLLDEPLSNLDARLRVQMRKELRSLQRRIKVTTVFVTHDQVEALSMSNRVAVMSRGVIAQIGTPRDIYRSPQDEFVASFIGVTTFFASTVEAVDGSSVRLSSDVGEIIAESDRAVAPGDPVTVAVRPESFRMSDVPVGEVNVFAGVIDDGLFVGNAIDYDVDVAGQVVRVKGSPRDRFPLRSEVFLSVDPQDCVLIPAAQSSSDEGHGSAYRAGDAGGSGRHDPDSTTPTASQFG
jgi:iron(III) transport system ATP-binding protein